MLRLPVDRIHIRSLLTILRITIDSTGRGKGTEAVAGEVGAIRGIDTEHGVHLLLVIGIKRAPL